MENFWFVSPRSGGSWTWVYPLDLELEDGRDPWPELEVDVARGDVSALVAPPEFRVDQRGKLGDLLWSTGGPYKLASDRLVELLDRAGTKGWSARPATIAYKNGDSLDGYNLLFVTGECDEVLESFDASTKFVRRGQICATGIDVSEGWDGTDVFYSRGRADRDFIVTDPVYRDLKAAKLAGVEFTKSTDREVFLGWEDDEA